MRRRASWLGKLESVARRAEDTEAEEVAPAHEALETVADERVDRWDGEEGVDCDVGYGEGVGR